MINKRPSRALLLSHRLTLGFLLLSNLAFIFLNSLTSAAVSAENSQSVYAFLDMLFGFFPFFTHTFVRKAAHFAEYALLGFLSFFSVRVFFEGRRRACFPLIAFGLLTAALDELLQLLAPGRVCSLLDCLLDFGGFLFGLLLSFLFELLRDRKRRAL